MVVRQPIKLRRVDILEEIENFKSKGGEYPDNMKLINIRGCNGSGKSTIPLQFLAKDRGAYLLTYEGKDVATVFPSYGFVAMGKYRNKTGGLDGYKNGEQTRTILEMLWLLPYSIIMEGVIASTIYSTYAELFKKLENKPPKRKIGIMNLVPPLELVKERLHKRNGGKKIKFEQVESKWRTVKKNAKKFAEAGFISWEADNSNISIEETLDWFFKEINEHIK